MCLRQGKITRRPRSGGVDRRGQIPDMVSIHVRPPEIEDRQMPGHWEGNLIKGKDNASAVGTLVERQRLSDPDQNSRCHRDLDGRRFQRGVEQHAVGGA